MQLYTQDQSGEMQEDDEGEWCKWSDIPDHAKTYLRICEDREFYKELVHQYMAAHPPAPITAPPDKP